MLKTTTLLTVICLSLFPSRSSFAQWTVDGGAVCTLAGGQHHPVAVADGAGGALIAWEDSRNSPVSGIDVYAQHIDADGRSLWTAGGVPVCSHTGNQQYLAIVGDGAGGAVVAWGDRRSGSYAVYTQRMSGTGTPVWTNDGIRLCTASPEQNFAVMVSDTKGGAIVSWLDTRTGDYDVYAQRVDGNGVLMWGPAGIAVCAAAGFQHSPYIAADGSGGAIMAWTDDRNGAPDIYAQRVNAAGSTLWTLGGAPVCQAVLAQIGGSVASDGNGGAIIVWSDSRLGNAVSNRDIYAQRMSAAAAPMWAVDGVPVCTASDEQYYPLAVSDEAGGVLVAWHDQRLGNYDIFAQRVDASGSPLWAPDGVALCTAPGTQSFVSMAADGAGGAIVTWPDARDATTANDVYAQRVDGSGAVRWQSDGAPLCTATREQSSPAVVSDGAGGTIVAWDDARSWNGITLPADAYVDIYAGHVRADGWVTTGIAAHSPPARISLAGNAPNPFSSTTRFDLTIADPSRVLVDIYDVSGRRILHRESKTMPAGVVPLNFDGRDQAGRLLPSGVYFCRVDADGESIVRKMLLVR
ncbi:MAG TPA: T9SS type A sorting domain-containing protein [Candidatus Krumholzibacteria bacterium]|nr:T9SS type A sorting domain-containing protein [Candidatus Krumholzibacteria bacterium]